MEHHRVSGLESRGRYLRFVEYRLECASDDLPASWRRRRIHASLAASHTDGSRCDPQPGRRTPRRGDRWIDEPHVGKPWLETKHEDAVLGSRVPIDHRT